MEKEFVRINHRLKSYLDKLVIMVIKRGVTCIGNIDEKI